MSLTKIRIIDEIKSTESSIEYWERHVEKLKEELEGYKLQLKSIEENETDSEKILYKYIFDTTRTIDLMDEFEHGGYQKILIKNTLYGNQGHYHLIIARLTTREYVGNITMTDFKLKKGTYRKLISHVELEVAQAMKLREKTADMEIIFEKPFKLRAQNSSNRTDYGNEYNGRNLVREGTLYGETTPYAFVGVVVE